MLAGNQLEQLEILNQRLTEAEKLNEKLSDRLDRLEHRVLSKNRHRWDLIEKIADYFMGAQVAGHYAEFGVYRGETFGHAVKTLSKPFPDMTYWAFDSFEGLPEPKNGIDRENGYSGGFYEGQFSCSKEEFLENLRRDEVDLTRVRTVAGWYSDTLLADNPASAALDHVALAWIDCDLYESTVPVLDYLTDRITEGTVLVFDDWRCFRNQTDRGQQKACREWLERNPHIKLNLLIDNDYNGYALSVTHCG